MVDPFLRNLIHPTKPASLQTARYTIKIAYLLRRRARVAGALALKNKSIPIKKSEFTLSVERALKRAKKRSYDTARLHNNPVYIWKDDKVVAIKP